MNYTDVFGAATVPPSEYAYRQLTLTADVTLNWPDNYSGPDTASAIMNVVDNTVDDLAITLPSANEVSVGRDLLFRNTGTYRFTIKDSDGTTVTTLVSGESKYVYVTDNSTAAGVWSVITYGVGSSVVDAGSLVGYGVKAINDTLNQSHPITNIYTNYTVQLSDRSKLIVHNGGAHTVFLPPVNTAGNDFFVIIRNSGTGTLTIDPYGTETVDGVVALYINPGESLFLCSSGTTWFSVGYGRATEFNFTQLTKDVSAGGTFTLTAAEAANKLLTFVGTPSLDYTVIVPPTIQVYYINNNVTSVGNISVLVKTETGDGPQIDKNQRLIVFCDGVNVYSATSTDSYTTIIDIGDSGYASARYAYTEETGGNTSIAVPYSGYLSVQVYVNGLIQSEEYNDYDTVEAGTNTIFTFGTTLNLGDRVYFVFQYMAEFSAQSSIERHVYTATSGQTTFTWTTSSFDGADALVFVDGVKQASGYTLFSTSVEFDTGLHVGAIVEIDLVKNVQAGVTATAPILMMQQEINANTVIPTGYNALSVDPTVNAVVTVSAGSVWAIVGE